MNMTIHHSTILCIYRGLCTLVPSLQLCYVCTQTFIATILLLIWAHTCEPPPSISLVEGLHFTGFSLVIQIIQFNKYYTFFKNMLFLIEAAHGGRIFQRLRNYGWARD